MFRKWIFGGIAGLAVLTPLTFAPSAQAHDRVYVNELYHSHHAVIYRTYGFGPWRVYAVFHSQRAAHHTAESLRFQGFNARVVHR
jgi:hypothetical protein